MNVQPLQGLVEASSVLPPVPPAAETPPATPRASKVVDVDHPDVSQHVQHDEYINDRSPVPTVPRDPAMHVPTKREQPNKTLSEYNPKDWHKYPNRRNVEALPVRIKDIILGFDCDKMRDSQYDWDDRVRSRSGKMSKYQMRVRFCVYLLISDQNQRKNKEPDRILVDYY